MDEQKYLKLFQSLFISVFLAKIFTTENGKKNSFILTPLALFTFLLEYEMLHRRKTKLRRKRVGIINGL